MLHRVTGEINWHIRDTSHSVEHELLQEAMPTAEFQWWKILTRWLRERETLGHSLDSANYNKDNLNCYLVRFYDFSVRPSYFSWSVDTMSKAQPLIYSRPTGIIYIFSNIAGYCIIHFSYTKRLCKIKSCYLRYCNA